MTQVFRISVCYDNCELFTPIHIPLDFTVLYVIVSTFCYNISNHIINECIWFCRLDIFHVITMLLLVLVYKFFHCLEYTIKILVYITYLNHTLLLKINVYGGVVTYNNSNLTTMSV